MKKRETELDILRLLAMLAVIWVHVGGMETRSLPTSDQNCQILIFMKSLATWQIPVFVMISGRFFLDPDRPMPCSKILKSIGRLVLAFAVWNAVYQIWYIARDVYTGLNWKGILSQALIGAYHLWYLYMIVGLYLITPFLRKIAEDKRLSEYFVGLFFLFMLLTKYCVALPLVGSTLSQILDSMGMRFVLGYSGYYVLGYYLRRYPLSGSRERILYICGAVLLVLGATANTVCSVREGTYTERFTGYTNPNTIIVAAAIYTLFINRINKAKLAEKAIRLVSTLSEYSFGVYLLHPLVLDFVGMTGLSPTMLHPIIMMPFLMLLTFAATSILVMLVRKIPCIGRKIT